jgi:hypothetical protein
MPMFEKKNTEMRKILNLKKRLIPNLNILIMWKKVY